MELVTVRRETETAGQTGLVENQGLLGEPRLDIDVSEVIIEKILDSLVDRTQAIGQPAREFPLTSQEWFDEFDLSVFGFCAGQLQQS